MKNLKPVIAFVAGAAIAGTMATAATTQTPTITACADTRTKALYLATNGTCTGSRKPIVIGNTATSDAKTIASLVTPSVVSILVTT